MIELLKTYLRKNAPLFGAIGGVGGFISDVLAPLANFALYLLIASFVGVLATAFFYYYVQRDHIVTKREEALTRLLFFGVFTLIWGMFTVIHVFGPTQGVLANTVPGIEGLQAQMGIVQKDVGEIKQTTAEIKGDTEAILRELQTIKTDLQAAQNGVVTSNPNTAQEWYINAVLYAAAGDEEAAVRAYQEFFAYGYPYLDAYQTFNILAKNELSKKELQNFYQELVSKQPRNVVARLMLGALIKDTEDRRSAYDETRAAFGDSAIVLYWLMNEYSVIGTYIYANELSANERQQWNTGDQSKLKEIVLAYEQLPLTDSLEPYFISAFTYDGVKTLINSFQNQFADQAANAMLDNPVVLVVNPTGETDQSMITFIIYDSYKDIRYRIPGTVDTFTSTIPDEAPASGPWGTSSPSPELSVTVDIEPGQHDIEVYWVNANNQQSETYLFEDVAFLDFAAWSKLTTTPVWVYPRKP